MGQGRSEEGEAGQGVMLLVEQLELQLDWGKEPWSGRSPRSLTRGNNVDKSGVSSGSREAGRFETDPAQTLIFLKGSPSYGS